MNINIIKQLMFGCLCALLLAACSTTDIETLQSPDGALTLTTGISYNIFSADKTLDSEWDKLVMKFLANNDINFKEL